MSNGSKKVKGPNPAPRPSEGIFYVARFPEGWKPMALRFESGVDVGHPVFWGQKVVPCLARAWSPVLRRSVAELASALDLCEYGFPRGRVVRQGARHLIYHGNNLTPFMKIRRPAIESIFELACAARWEDDEHERCLSKDKDTIRQLLRLHEDWPHAKGA